MSTGTKNDSLQAHHSESTGELERYKLLVEHVEDYAIFMMDKNGYIQTWNKGAQKNKGYTADEIIGKHFSTFYMENDIEAKKPERELELATRYGRVEDEDWRVRKDGTRFWANVVITALRDGSGELVGFAKVTRNLTERKQHEDSLREANIILRRQQSELEKLNASKDEFVSLASHQLRTPATAIKQLLGMLVEGFAGKLAPDQMTLIEEAYRSNDRQLEIVNSLLKVAQVDAGKVVLNMQPIGVDKFVKDTSKWHLDTFKERRQNFAIENTLIGDQKIIMDRDHIRMAIDNLLDNASKYTPPGGSIKLTATSDNDEVRITVKDSGVGIAKQDLNKLFQRFSRVNNELSGKVGGSGLGLYWAGKIVNLHGGRIEVRSKKNVGSNFTVVLPSEGKSA